LNNILDKIKFILNESRSGQGNIPVEDRLITTLNPDTSPDKFKKIMQMRNEYSDVTIANRLRYDRQALRRHLEKYKDHPHYVPPLNPSKPRHSDDFKKTVIGLHYKGHSYKGIANILSTPKNKLSRNTIAGIIDRHSPEERNKIISDISKGNEPKLYSQHKDKPIIFSQRRGRRTRTMENNILNRIHNILNEAKKPQWVKTRQDVIDRLHASETPEEVDLHLGKIHEALKTAHDTLHDIANHKDTPLSVKNTAKKIRQELAKQIDTHIVK
jgi:hypothetical protein